MKRKHTKQPAAQVPAPQPRREVARLGGLAGAGLDIGTLKGILEKLDEEELLALKEGYARRARERFPAGVQLTYRGEGEQAPQQDGAFLI